VSNIFLEPYLAEVVCVPAGQANKPFLQSKSMAIIDHFEITILVDGDPAAEFDDDEQPLVQFHDSKVITKYIEVKSGARFAFKYKVLPTYKFDMEDACPSVLSSTANLSPAFSVARKAWTPERASLL
jgi:hypothetical protein